MPYLEAPLLLLSYLWGSLLPLCAFASQVDSVDGNYIPARGVLTLPRPQISDTVEITMFVKEHADNGTVVGILNQQFPFLQSAADLYYQMYGLGPTYEFGEPSVSGTSRRAASHSNDSMELLFHIDPTSSVIRVSNSQWLDRELLCPFASGNNKECSLAYAVSISGKAKATPRLTPQQSWIRVKIVVEDINDNPPRFQPINDSETATASPAACNLHLQLSEAVQIGTKLKLPDAIDLDSQANGLPIYQFSCEEPNQVNDVFTLRQSRGENAVSRIWLLLSSTLDHERQATYNCTLTACDNGMPILCSSLRVCISVHDVNDNSPVFQNSNISLSLREDTPLGSRVAKFNATDADSGNFGLVRFALVGGGQEDYNNQSHFRVDAKTGDLILKRRLIGGTKYHFWAEARDGGEPESLSARIPVSVIVTDVNNHAPRIDILPAAVRVRISNSTAADAVRSVMSQVRSAPCELAYGFPDSSEGNRACDQHSLVRIFEDNLPPSNIAFVRVSDEDVGENAHVSCELTVEPSSSLLKDDVYLQMEHQTSSGKTLYKLVLNRTVDCEAASPAGIVRPCGGDWTLHMRMTCHDNGQPRQQTLHKIALEVLDANEHPPVFEKSLYTVELKESLPVGSNVIQLSVTDQDSLPRGSSEITVSAAGSLLQHLGQTLKFSLDSNETLPFAIDTLSGRIYSTEQLDAETRTEYNLTVLATNTGVDNVTLRGSCTVRVLIRNVNDHPPEFLPPQIILGRLQRNHSWPEALAVVQLPENLPHDTAFMQLSTQDRDQPSTPTQTADNKNSIIRLRECRSYKLNGLPVRSQVAASEFEPSSTVDPEAAAFAVDESSGTVTTVAHLDREKVDYFECVLTAEDDDDTYRLTSTATIIIRIEDQNDNAPVWLYPRSPDDSRIQLGIDFPTNRIITRVRAVDADLGPNARIHYSLQEVSFVHFNHPPTCDLLRLFSLEKDRGLLRMLENALEGVSPRTCLQPGDSVRLLLRATDSGSPALTKDAELFLDFRAGDEIFNIPLQAESNFLTQADEAMGKAPARSEGAWAGEAELVDSNRMVPKPTAQEDQARGNGALVGSKGSPGATEGDSSKRLQMFALRIIVPLGAILLSCCLITAVILVVRARRNKGPRRRGRPRAFGQRQNQQQRRDCTNKEGGSAKPLAELETLSVFDGSELNSGLTFELSPSLPETKYVKILPAFSQGCFRGRLMSGEASLPETQVFFTAMTGSPTGRLSVDRSAACVSDNTLKMHDLSDLSCQYTLANMHMEETGEVGESGEGSQRQETPVSSHLVYSQYPIYLRPVEAQSCTASGSPADSLMQLSSIPELERGILIPLPKAELANQGAATTSSSSSNQQKPIPMDFLAPNQGMLMACVVPDADKCSADSGKGQSDDDVFLHEGIQSKLPAGFIYVPVCSGLDSLKIKPSTEFIAVKANQLPTTTAANM
ncbi:hypothetical protein AAHC03_010238 [Spirometra sp. Aus1]